MSGAIVKAHRCARQRPVDDRILLRLPGAVAEIRERIRALRLPAMAEALVEARLEPLVGREALEQAQRHDGPILKRTVGQIGRRVVHAGRGVIREIDVGIDLFAASTGVDVVRLQRHVGADLALEPDRSPAARTASAATCC